MKTIQESITQRTALKCFDQDKQTVVQCDMSNHGLGAALFQDSQPVAFASRTLSVAERCYGQIEKECLATVFACEKFEYYLVGKEAVQVQSNHKPLKAIFQ